MIIRIQSSEGIKRVELDQNDKLLVLFDKVKTVLNLSCSFKLFKERDKKSEIRSTTTKTLKQSNLKHGDIIYLEKITKETRNDVNVGASTSKSNSQNDLSTVSNGNETLKMSNSQDKLEEDKVDIILRKDNGLIYRDLDPTICKHGTNAKCINCMPLEPFDEGYLKENNIKHLSFHSYLRKQTAGMDKGKFAALENISCKIKNGCSDHLPWPKGICTKCQPNAVTLSRQHYRHVDNIVFENTTIVEQFLNYWRVTGHQRIGFLYGYYERHTGVPLGIKANVLAIYEPPQESNANYVKLTLPDKNEKIVENLTHKLGLKRVGWIFTDLISQDATKGTVKHFRNVDNYFLTAQECIMAGYFQTIYPNICKLSNDGYFGSKFVTVIVTGDKNNQIHMEGYQVSNQCMALVRDRCLIPTKDAPELAYVKETSKEQYVPDVFFTEKDKFNNEIKRVARLLPIEYLLIDVPVSTPLEQKHTFNYSRSKKPFAIENRAIQGHLQDFTTLSEYLNQFKKEEFLDAIKDFHLLIYLSTMDMISFKNDLDKLFMAIRDNEKNKAIEWSKNENWQTLEQLIEAQKSANAQPTSSSSRSNSITNSFNQTSHTNNSLTNDWHCRHCTFTNTAGRSSCEMCSLPNQF